MVGVDTQVFHGYVNCGATGVITGIGPDGTFPIPGDADVIYGVGRYLMPLESVWGLACPIAGPLSGPPVPSLVTSPVPLYWNTITFHSTH